MSGPHQIDARSIPYRDTSSRLRIIVLGYIVRGPVGGLVWHHLQYVMGLAQCGHDVYFAEDSGDTPWSCYDPTRHTMDTDPTYGLQFATQTFERVGLADRWAYYDAHTSRWLGPYANHILETFTTADILLNLSGVNPLRPWLIIFPQGFLSIPIQPSLRSNILLMLRHKISPCNTPRFFHLVRISASVGAAFRTIDCPGKLPDSRWSWKRGR